MGLSVKNGIGLYSVDGFCADGKAGHCFTARYGGVSGDSGDLLNMSFSKEPDRPANVIANIRRVAGVCGFDGDRVTAVLQVHGDGIVRVTEELAGARVSKPWLVKEADGLVTDIPGVVLMTTHGDCLPVFLYDKRGAIGLVHSGWRGTAARIAAKAVACMERAFGTDPGDVSAAVGPGICSECFLVDAPVADVFKERFGGADVVREALVPGKFTVDLAEAVRLSLVEAGVPGSSIFLCGECTASPENAGVFFSHRREKGANQGLAGAFMWLRQREKPFDTASL